MPAPSAPSTASRRPGCIWCCRSGRCFRARRRSRRPRSCVRVRGTLEPQQIRAIRHLVASAVNGLKPQRVSIVDEAGQLLADGAGGDDRQRRRRRAPRRLREADAQAGRGDRLVGGRRRPRPRPALGRLRLQQDHPDLGQVRSRRPGAALEPDPRGIQRHRRQQRPGHRQQRTAGQPGPGHRARPRATRARRPRKPTITRFPAPPRPK